MKKIKSQNLYILSLKSEGQTNEQIYYIVDAQGYNESAHKKSSEIAKYP